MVLGLLSGNGFITGMGLVGGGSVALAGGLQRSNQTEVVVTQPVPPAPAAAPPRKKKLSTLKKGDVLAEKYRVESKLGEGGFGATFLVSDITKNIQNTYVAKAQKLTGKASQDEELVERFEREAAALQQIGSGHGQIPTLFDYFDDQGNFFLIQEQVKGKTLMDALIEMIDTGHVFSIGYALKLIDELLDVVQHLHVQGLIHRDIKPQNIILREGDGKPVLIDFGLVKQTDDDNPLQTGTMAGTPGFMPIEQQMGKALYQSDLYAIGMVFLLLTTGVPPHQLDVNEQIEFDLDWTQEQLGESLSHWLRVAIAPLPQNRFGSADEMRQALLSIRDQSLMAAGYGQALEALGIASGLNAADQQGKTANVRVSDVRREGRAKNLPSQLVGIITTQKEIDAFNALKRLLERNGLEGDLLDMEDTPDFCNIHLKEHPNLVVVRLYFNDESKLAFAIPDENGLDTVYPISTLRGIAPKTEAILARLEVVQQQAGLSVQQKDVQDYIPQDDEDLVEREIRPAIIETLTDMFGPDFRLLSIQTEDNPFRIYGQFEGLETQAGRVFDYELSHNAKGQLAMVYRMNPECLAQEEAEETARNAEEDRLATDGIYTVGWLQRNFDSFQAAKEHFGVRAKSWTKLAERLNQAPGE
ncbi:protein kinase [Nodosilinea sp. LEGE 07088]|uniref:protein kinase domain-containing protein n=1 Tax=Nodosilinea sp. LEGE 07088 TaxID=2777968 RepID=UPI001882B8B3|nr:protein kinase [Nodosilinea sp. LEGE 07088]MBE9136936.1 protein kinase [Nodosilinea sp. LEGE 07088]